MNVAAGLFEQEGGVHNLGDVSFVPIIPPAGIFEQEDNGNEEKL